MKEIETIWLFKDADSWCIQTDKQATIDLFGTDILPTAFTTQAPTEMVLARIQELNPDAIIELA